MQAPSRRFQSWLPARHVQNTRVPEGGSRATDRRVGDFFLYGYYWLIKILRIGKPHHSTGLEENPF